MSEKSIKVTDRRMFTADGQLREEYQHLGSATEPVEPRQPASGAVEPGVSGPIAAPAAAPGPVAPQPVAPQPAAPQAAPEPPPDADAPGFYDLVAMLAESASVYLQQARRVDRDALQSLELARLHIQLLEVLKRKTAGNLDAQERAYLDSALYQLRMAAVEVAG